MERDGAKPGRRGATAGRIVLPVVAAALVACAAYEAAVAAGAIGIGSQPGEGPAGDALVVMLALLALFLGGALLAAGARSPVSALVPVAAVALLAARFFAYDPYYAPGLRRMSDQGLVSPVWIALLGAAGIAVAVVVRLRPRAGGPPAALLLLLVALTALAESAGH